MQLQTSEVSVMKGHTVGEGRKMVEHTLFIAQTLLCSIQAHSLVRKWGGGGSCPAKVEHSAIL